MLQAPCHGGRPCNHISEISSKFKCSFLVEERHAHVIVLIFGFRLGGLLQQRGVQQASRTIIRSPTCDRRRGWVRTNACETAEQTVLLMNECDGQGEGPSSWLGALGKWFNCKHELFQCLGSRGDDSGTRRRRRRRLFLRAWGRGKCEEHARHRHRHHRQVPQPPGRQPPERHLRTQSSIHTSTVI